MNMKAHFKLLPILFSLFCLSCSGTSSFESITTGKVEFEYDGLKFTTVATTEDLKGDWQYSDQNDELSKASEVKRGRSDKKDRESVNNSFAEKFN